MHENTIQRLIERLPILDYGEAVDYDEKTHRASIMWNSYAAKYVKTLNVSVVIQRINQWQVVVIEPR